MSQKNILILDATDSPWPAMLTEFFEDTSAHVFVTDSSQQAGQFLDRSRPCFVFAAPALLTPPFAQKLKFATESTGETCLILLGKAEGISSSHCFEDVPGPLELLKTVTGLLNLPEVIKVLIVDDEAPIAAMIMDYLGGRKAPSFQVSHAENGVKGLQKIRREKPDVLILDVKMPEKDGRQVYREIRESEMMLPVIVFFDAISGDEISHIHQWGRPAVVEKGAAESAMPQMMHLIKKLAFFG